MSVFLPHLTVAAIVFCQGRYLMVEEIIDGRHVFNQPAGHVEDNEGIVAALERELWEETNLTATPNHLVSIALWRHSNSLTFLRFNFAVRLDHPPKNLHPNDADIYRTLWLTRSEIIARQDQLRSHLVLDAINDFENDQEIPLTALKSYL